MEATLAFPDVLRVDLVNADGSLLMGRGTGGFAKPGRLSVKALPREAHLDQGIRRRLALHCASLTRSEASPLTWRPQGIVRGHVRVVYSKATLQRMTAHVFFANLISFTCAAAFWW